MSLKIAQLGQPVLRTAAAAVSTEELRSPNFQLLIDEMLELLAEEEGAGLAGPQVFAGKRLFVAAVLPGPDEDTPSVEVFVNPKIIGASEESASSWEGCLSFPELLVLVPRRLAVRISYLTRHGESLTSDFYAFPARVIQHECDHLDGILTLDRAESILDIIKASEIETVKELRKLEAQ